MPDKVSYKDLYSLVDTRTSEIMSKFDKLEERVSFLEQWRSEIVGKMALLTAFVSVAFTAVWDYIKKKINA